MSLGKKNGVCTINIRSASIAVLVVGSLLFCASLTKKGYASSVQPGSESDPLVSQSYVDGKINQIQTQISSIVSSIGSNGVPIEPGVSGGITNEEKDIIVDEVIAKLEFLYGEINTTQSQPERFEPVFANKGDILILGEGTELVLRSGYAEGFIMAANGLSNVSNGSEINNNDNVPLNNLIISSRDDGRGVLAIEDSWFLIKGDYDFLR